LTRSATQFALPRRNGVLGAPFRRSSGRIPTHPELLFRRSGALLTGRDGCLRLGVNLLGASQGRCGTSRYFLAVTGRTQWRPRAEPIDPRREWMPSQGLAGAQARAPRESGTQFLTSWSGRRASHAGRMRPPLAAPCSGSLGVHSRKPVTVLPECRSTELASACFAVCPARDGYRQAGVSPLTGGSIVSLDAIGVTRERCRKFNWVLEFDVRQSPSQRKISCEIESRAAPSLVVKSNFCA
jgi:hypothetical protein